ncbi:MAG TPA: STAS domain-containing protein [Thermoanaerobaculia bacterium]|nr:STAS domain-containing protein [Thermoanaerobaculia bacterium]
MEIQIDSSAAELRRVKLVGRLDSAGAGAVETKFNAATAGAGVDSIADLSGVTFIASLGIRMLVTAARTLAAKEKKLVLVVGEGLVAETLRDGGIDQLVPMVATAAEAEALLASG